MRTPLHKGEKIILVTHKSWTALVLPLLIGIAGCVAAYFIGFIQHWGWIAAVLGLGFLVLKYYAWKATIWVVTNYRVIYEAGLSSHSGKENFLDKINDVDYKQTFMERIFNYGQVEIQTAAQPSGAAFYNVSHPRRLKDTITAAQSEYKNLQLGNQASQLAAAFTAGAFPAPSSGGNQTHTGTNPPAIAAELEKLFDLKQKGALSQEEYERAKNRLLGH